ncbi:MAG TPA: class I SAM-dependent methyltransferase family protein, partial [Pyrinomonadaceae bacterium]
MRTSEEHSFMRADGRRLSYTYWRPSSSEGQDHRAVLLLHDGGERQEQLRQVVEELNLPDFGIAAWAAGAQASSSDDDGSSAGLSGLVRELDAFARHVSRHHGIDIGEMAVMAQGFEAVLAAVWAHDYAPRLRCMILARPAFEIRERVKPAPTGEAQSKSPNDALRGVDSASERIIADAQAMHTPLQLFISGSDLHARQQSQLEFFERFGSEVKEKHVCDGFDNDGSGWKNDAQSLATARDFLLKTFEQPLRRDFLLHADRSGHTKEEFEALCRPLPLFSSRRLSFAAAQFFMRTVGFLSDGIRLGLKTGFDSGSTFDYVYRSQPAGITRLGRNIDESYLNSIGWRGIRVRRQHLQELLIRSARQLQSEGQPVRVLDIAAGVGRYVLDAVAKLESKVDGILLRDYSELDVRQGRALIEEKGLEGIASFEQGDAFDRASLAAIRPRPTLAIVCGLYELFPDNS